MQQIYQAVLHRPASLVISAYRNALNKLFWMLVRLAHLPVHQVHLMIRIFVPKCAQIWCTMPQQWFVWILTKTVHSTSPQVANKRVSPSAPPTMCSDRAADACWAASGTFPTPRRWPARHSAPLLILTSSLFLLLIRTRAPHQMVQLMRPQRWATRCVLQPALLSCRSSRQASVWASAARWFTTTRAGWARVWARTRRVYSWTTSRFNILRFALRIVNIT